MKKIWVNKCKSFKEAEEFERKYYKKMTLLERLGTIQFIRETHFKLMGIENETRKGLQRVIKIIHQK